MRLSTIICALTFAATTAQAAPARWIGSWGASPTAPTAAAPGVDARRVSPTFSNQTLVELVRLSAGGPRLRLRLSNEYGAKPLAVGAVRVALMGADGAALAGTERAVSFSGEKTAVIAAGAPLLSDPVALPTDALSRLRVSIYLPGDSGPCTCHMAGAESVQVSPPGDWTERPLPPASSPAVFRAFLSGVEVETASATAPVVVTLGDSITDGAASTRGANRRWPDRLAERLAETSRGRSAAVVNAGIGGNRVLTDGVVPAVGQSALTRFDRDVLAVPGATHLIILEGVNDLGSALDSPPSAGALIAGFRQLIARGHAHGLKVYGATILPYGGAGYFRPVGEAVRQEVNAWIRTGHEFDGVVDFDAAMRDPAKPERMKAELQSGDWLHPNDAGYRVMGDAIDLKLFR